MVQQCLEALVKDIWLQFGLHSKTKLIRWWQKRLHKMLTFFFEVFLSHYFQRDQEKIVCVKLLTECFMWLVASRLDDKNLKQVWKFSYFSCPWPWCIYKCLNSTEGAFGFHVEKMDLDDDDKYENSLNTFPFKGCVSFCKQFLRFLREFVVGLGKLKS